MDFHASARPSFILVMPGTIESETTDGARHTWRAGEMFFSDDSGRGHRTRAVDGPTRLLFVHPPASRPVR